MNLFKLVFMTKIKIIQVKQTGVVPQKEFVISYDRPSSYRYSMHDKQKDLFVLLNNKQKSEVAYVLYIWATYIYILMCMFF